ncbi:hypothetical protein BgiBS90_029314, partial [Biomphalaria glabrata]
SQVIFCELLNFSLDLIMDGLIVVPWLIFLKDCLDPCLGVSVSISVSVSGSSIEISALDCRTEVFISVSLSVVS